MKRFILLAISLAACKWTDFDDLSDKTWVHSHGKPSIGSTDYGVSIVGASTSGDGGQVAVVSTDAPTYSTINYDAKGGSKTGDTVLKLGQHFITSLAAKPILVTDGNGNVALVEKAIDANEIAVIAGPAGSPSDLAFAGSPPQAAAYAGSKLIVAAAATAPGAANLFVVDGATTTNCLATEEDGTTALAVGAIAVDSTRLWVWSKTGSVFAYDLAAVEACTTSTPISATAGTTFTPATAFAPGSGARIHIVGSGAGELAILAGHADKATNGEVVTLSVPATGAPTQITSLPADGMLSSTVATFDSTMYLVIGFPEQTVENVMAGEVDIYELPANGMIPTMAAETLFDAQPDNGELFGRDVTTMQFNGHTVLVVAASNEVFSYYRTSLYQTDTRNPAP